MQCDVFPQLTQLLRSVGGGGRALMPGVDFLWGPDGGNEDEEEDVIVAPGNPAQEPAEPARNWFHQRLLVQRRKGVRGKVLSRVIADHASLAACANPGKAHYISATLAANTGKKRRYQDEVVTFLDDASAAMAVDRSNKQRGAYGHALVDHLEGVKTSLASVMQGSEMVIISECSDDASLWCRLPPDEVRKAATRQSASNRSKAAVKGRGKGRGKRAGLGSSSAVGRNKNTPFMTIVQHAFLKENGQANACARFKFTRLRFQCQRRVGNRFL